MMEEDETQMSKEELQKWIRDKINKDDLISPDLLKKYKLLQSLLERREKQAAHFLKLCESVAACEAIVKKQYSLLGLQYRDTDSDDDIRDCEGQTPSPSLETIHSETEVVHSSPTNSCSPLSKLDSEKLNKDNGEKSSHTPVRLMKELVVVLTRLPASKIKALCPPTSPEPHTKTKSSVPSSDSEISWEPDEDSNDYDFSSFTSGSNKRKRRGRLSNKTHAWSHTAAKSKARAKADVKSSAATSAPRANGNDNTETKTTEPSATNTNGNIWVTTAGIVSGLCQSTDKPSGTPPGFPQAELSVNMRVIARRRSMTWQRGKIVDILTKDGRLKYKVTFEEKGKSLVSGHHIAFDNAPKAEHLFVGARVVVKCQADQSHFSPGVLAELPNRKNSERFLVFTDAHTPVYVSLPFFHMVFKPLADPLEDILDNGHKIFMKEYLKSLPDPPQTQYKVGQLISVEFNGIQQKCEVEVVDCSLIQVVFQKDQHKEWIYRGSLRLGHMNHMREHLESKK